MDTAVTLRRDASLGFVVAPVPARDGEPVRPLPGTEHACQAPDLSIAQLTP